MVAIWPVIIKGSTGFATTQVRRQKFAIANQRKSFPKGLKVRLLRLLVWRWGRRRGTSRADIMATTPPSLLGIERSMA